MSNRFFFFFLFGHLTVMLCVKPWGKRESDNWETKAFQCSARPNMGALPGKPHVHYFLALPWFIPGLNNVGRKSCMVFLHGTWGMGFEEPAGHHEMGGCFPCPLSDMPESHSGPALVYSLLTWKNSLCFPVHVVLQNPNQRSPFLKSPAPGVAWVPWAKLPWPCVNSCATEIYCVLL